MSDSMWEQEECCGNCRYHKRDPYEGVWFCTNRKSEMKWRHTRYEYRCDKYEKKPEE